MMRDLEYIEKLGIERETKDTTRNHGYNEKPIIQPKTMEITRNL